MFRKPHLLSGPVAFGLVLFVQSTVLGRSSGSLHDEPWNADHFDRLPPEVRSAVARQCAGRHNAAHYFATYLDNGKTIRLHYEQFSCEGRQAYRDAERCLHQEFVLSGARYRLARSYYGQCND